MNAYELADKLEWHWDNDCRSPAISKSIDMLRQQADRITELERLVSDMIYEKSSGVYDRPQIKELSDEEIKPLLDRIQKYLECGGLFNPECMEHDKVRDLIMACKAILKKASEK